ncbi:unnamed protein product [Sphagnum jensenii]|uniref:DRBM domain-containing protein n=1 Tax=Sphagnum jensenii TaxID=128206 RepID=A0ABP1AR17_9BRYO
MYKNQLQELAQRSCFNLPAYACIREGPDHAPRFKATVIFNGELFQSPNYCSTLRQAEHAAAEVALNTLSRRNSCSRSLAARFLDETGICKNLLQETAQRAGVSLPVYTTTRSGPGHLPVFTSSVEVTGMTFLGDAARTKKQAEKNAAMAAWSALKQLVNRNCRMAQQFPGAETLEQLVSEEQEQNTIAGALAIANSKELSTSTVTTMQQQQLPSHSSDPASRNFCNHPAAHRSVIHRQQEVVSTPARSIRSSAVALRDVSCLLSREEALAASRSVTACCCMSNLERSSAAVPPVQTVRNLTTQRDNRHEVPAPLSEHQLDEDEWLRGLESSKTITRETNNNRSQDEVSKEEAAAAHGSAILHSFYNPLSWSENSSCLWGTAHHAVPVSKMRVMPQTAAMPVRLRPAVTVCAAPPPSPPHPQKLQDEKEDKQEGEAAAAAAVTHHAKLLNQLNL